jgi:hypothetical protein
MMGECSYIDIDFGTTGPCGERLEWEEGWCQDQTNRDTGHKEVTKQPFLGPLSAPQNHWQQVFPSAYPTYFNPEDAGRSTYLEMSLTLPTTTGVKTHNINGEP